MDTRVKHGMYKSTVYRRWIYMKSRCKSDIQYIKQGITVCDEWVNDFMAFYKDMGEPPMGHTLDRIDGKKGYSPTNCRWATYKEQNNNLRTNVYINGQPLSDVVKETGLHRNTIIYRVAKGIPLTEKKIGNRDTCSKGHRMDRANSYITTTKDRHGNQRTSKYCRKCRAEYQAQRRKGTRDEHT